MVEKSEWISQGTKEAPYWRDGMTLDEYEAEREYYYKHLDDVRNGTYQPMWKQHN